MAENKTTQKTVEGVMLGKTISESVEEVNAKYKKPDTYTGNRKLFDDAKAKIDIKKLAFANGKVKDPYTGKTLYLKKLMLKLNLVKTGLNIWLKPIINVH